MAVFKAKCANTEIKIYETDHPPPHCHVVVNGRDVRIKLETLEVFWSSQVLPPKLRKCLERKKSAMMEAWRRVQVMGPPGE